MPLCPQSRSRGSSFLSSRRKRSSSAQRRTPQMHPRAAENETCSSRRSFERSRAPSPATRPPRLRLGKPDASGTSPAAESPPCTRTSPAPWFLPSFEMADFHYVYILVSAGDPRRHYTGLTEDLSARLGAHNAGQVPHTSAHPPWRVETAIAFRSRTKALSFERYLKSHSGRAFARRHF